MSHNPNLFSNQIENDEKVNVLFILVDDLGYKDLGCYGSTFYETPHIDALAENSYYFNNAYAVSPVCSPNRAAILTGRYPTNIGITDWIPGGDPQNRPLIAPKDIHQLPDDEITISEVFKSKGYKTFFSGKWHLGGEGSLPINHGFDYNIGGYHVGQPSGGYYTPYENPYLDDGPKGEYLTDRLTDEAIQFMVKNKDNPFFAFLSYYTVHTPIQANTKFINHFDQEKKSLPVLDPQFKKEPNARTVINQYNADYASMVASLDENIGKLMHYLRESGLSKNTLVIFTSDNGGLSTLTNNRGPAPTSVAPYRAGKGWLYEGGIKVPLIIRVPGLDAGQEIFTSALSIDLFPTILDYCKINNSYAEVNGISLQPIMNQNAFSKERPIFFHFPHYHGSGWTPGSALIIGGYKLLHFYEDNRYELYHLTTDPVESSNLSRVRPEKTKSMIKLLNKYRKRHNAINPSKNNNYSDE